jgi:hypothetical protein
VCGDSITGPGQSGWPTDRLMPTAVIDCLRRRWPRLAIVLVVLWVILAIVGFAIKGLCFGLASSSSWSPQPSSSGSSDARPCRKKRVDAAEGLISPPTCVRPDFSERGHSRSRVLRREFFPVGEAKHAETSDGAGEDEDDPDPDTPRCRAVCASTQSVVARDQLAGSPAVLGVVGLVEAPRVCRSDTTSSATSWSRVLLLRAWVHSIRKAWSIVIRC